MARISPKVRKEALERIRNGEAAADVASDLGIPAGNVRKWVFRDKGRPAERSGTVTHLAPKTNTAKLSPVELLEHDIAKARRHIEVMEEDGNLSGLPAMWRQVRLMQAELDAKRASIADADAEDDDAAIVEFLIAHMRCKRWARAVKADHQSVTTWNTTE